jgi:hypothetical protein
MKSDGGGRYWLCKGFVVAILAGVALLSEGVAMGQPNATNYFRPWTIPGLDVDLTNDWTDVNDPPAQGSVPAAQWIRYVDSVAGSDANEGLTPSTAVATIARAWDLLQGKRYQAYGHTQAPFAASIRLMRGSTFTERLGPIPDQGKEVVGGRGEMMPLVIEAWPRPGMPGGSVSRPVVRLPVDSNGVGTAPGWLMPGSALNSTDNEWGGDIWVIGLEITSQTIPGGVAAEWPALEPETGIKKDGAAGARYLLEDLYIHDVGSPFSFNGVVENQPERHISGVTIRRCVFERSWARTARQEDAPQIANHSGGGYFSKCKWVLYEENTMDQMGWSHLQGHPLLTEYGFKDAIKDAGLAPKNVFNHGLYMTQFNENVLVRNNIIARPSHNAIQSRGGSQRIENNLILCAPVGISLGHAQNQGQPACGFYDYATFVSQGWPLPPGCNPSNPPIPCGGCGSNQTTHFAHDPLFWRGQCKFNVILNGANVDRWQADPATGEVFAIEVDGDIRGRGLTISRCKMRDPNNVSYDYCEQTQLITSGPNVGGYAWETVRAGTVFKNLIANNDDGRENQAAGIYVDDDGDSAPNPAWISSYQAHIHNNIVYNWLGANPTGCLAVHINNSKTFSSGLEIRPPFCLITPGTTPPEGLDSEGPLGSDFQFENNHFIQDGYRKIGRARWNPVGGAWTNNLYFSKEQPSKRYQVQLLQTPPNEPFKSPENNSAYLGDDGWKYATNESSASEISTPPAYPDPTRTIGTYIEYQLNDDPGGSTQIDWTIRLMQLCAQQRRGNWNQALTASAINHYMRDGFGLVYAEEQTCP